MTTPPDRRSPYTEASEWVSRIAAVVAVMVLPGLAGQWLDRRLGVGFLGLIGFVGGVALGIVYLLVITKPRPPSGGAKQDTERD